MPTSVMYGATSWIRYGAAPVRIVSTPSATPVWICV